MLLQAKGDVVFDREVREYGVVLKDHSNIALAGLYVIDAGVPKIEVPALNGVKAGDHAQKRGLAASRWTQQGKQGAIFYIEAQIIYNRGIALIDLPRMCNSNFTHNYASPGLAR